MQIETGLIIEEKYQILAKHNCGGMGKTYLAKDLLTKHTVILKVLIFTEMENWKSFDLFEREVKILKQLKHPNIPDYLHHFEIEEKDNVYYFLVQEYIEGDNLYDLVNSGKSFSYEEVLSILKSLLHILQYLHELNPALIHRDIQPKNIILGPDGKVYLVDFGSVGHIARNTMVAGNTFVGTAGYFPQEQMMGKIYPNSDLYSLAMSMIFILTGRDPITMDIKAGKVDYHAFVSIPYALKSLLDKMIDPFQERRIESAQEVINLVNKIMVQKDFERKSTRVDIVEEERVEEEIEKELKDKAIKEDNSKIEIIKEENQTVIKINNEVEKEKGYFGIGLLILLLIVTLIVGKRLPLFFLSLGIMGIISYLTYNSIRYKSKMVLTKDRVLYQGNSFGLYKSYYYVPVDYGIKKDKLSYKSFLFISSAVILMAIVYGLVLGNYFNFSMDFFIFGVFTLFIVSVLVIFSYKNLKSQFLFVRGQMPHLENSGIEEFKIKIGSKITYSDAQKIIKEIDFYQNK